MTASTISVGTEPIMLDIEIIEQLLGVTEPASNFLSSTLFPSDRAFLVKGELEHFLAAHPDFWNRVPGRAAQLGIVQPYRSLEIVDVDQKPGDTIAMREAKRRLRQRFGEALAWAIRSNNLTDRSG